MAAHSTKIKICGLRIPSDVEVVNEVLPDYCGFIFDPTRRRYVEPAAAEGLRSRLDPRIRPVGVFVNAGTQRILEVLDVCHVDMVQLHGQETNEDIDELRDAIAKRTAGIPGCGTTGSAQAEGASRGAAGERRTASAEEAVGRKDSCRAPASQHPFQIVKAFRIDTADDIQLALWSHADLVLLDHGIGGTGESFDWSLLRGCGRQFILAGGLGPDNVAEAINRTRPYAVDASSSLETDGHKDREKALAFAAAVRGAR